MKKCVIVIIILVIALSLGIFIFNSNEIDINKLEVMVMSVDDNDTMLMDKNDVVYTISNSKINLEIGDNVIISYTGIIDNSNVMDVEITDYELIDNEGDITLNGIFSQYYTMANRKLDELTLDEKIGQLILGRYPDNGAVSDVKKYGLSGFVFFEKDFIGKTKSEVIEMIDDVQESSDIPLLIAVDEEGGRVVRVSSNTNLVSERFRSSRELYLSGGMDEIRNDTINKSNVLFDLGINVNLAPVVDVSMDTDDYMYERSLGEDSETTAMYAKTVINASKGTGVSYTLKHFPGYGNNVDTHNGISIDNRSIESIMNNDILPFHSGIDVGAEAVLISHSIVSSIDSINSASLSLNIHNILRDKLGFTGVIITDDLSMGALDNEDDASVRALLSGNNLLITTDYVDSINSIKDAIDAEIISEEMINRLALRVLAWKYYKGLMLDEK